MERDKIDIIERKRKRALKNPEKRRKNRKQVKPETSETVEEAAEEKSEAWVRELYYFVKEKQDGRERVDRILS